MRHCDEDKAPPRAMPQWRSSSSCPQQTHGLCVIVIVGACVAAAAVAMERITRYDNQTYRLHLVIVAAKAAAAEAIIFVWGPGCHQCRNPNIQFKKMKKEETQNEENEKKAKIGRDKMQIGDDRKNRTTDGNPLANNRNPTMFVVDRNSVKYAIHTKHHTQSTAGFTIFPFLVALVHKHLLCVGWRNFFYSCAVVSVFGSGGE
jgi:hypothetical protein